MPDAEKPAEGWAYPTQTARKPHYFREHRSLCGKYGDFMLTLTPDTGAQPNDCTVCRRKLDAR